MKFLGLAAAALAANLATVFVSTKAAYVEDLNNGNTTGDHHGHHHRRHQRHHRSKKTSSTTSNTSGATALFKDTGFTTEKSVQSRGRLRVAGPLPVDFHERFSEAAAKAVACSSAEVKVLDSHEVFDGSPGQQLVVLDFSAPAGAVHAIEDQAADPNSNLTQGALRPFLMGFDADDASAASVAAVAVDAPADLGASPAAAPMPGSSPIDIDTDMPYGELEAFGREDTGQELTESSIKQSDDMVDQLERAEVAEEKRAVFRALTRLRGAAITSFDGIARSQTGNIDEYNKVHQWRKTHPLNHLADEESDVAKWAFPDDADF